MVKELLVLILSVGGVLFAGYLSAVAFFSDTCAFNESCPFFFGYPACYYGLAMYLLIAAGAYARWARHCEAEKANSMILSTALLGIFFSGYLTFLELPVLFTQGSAAYMLGVPTCALGLGVYVLIFALSVRLRSADTPRISRSMVAIVLGAAAFFAYTMLVSDTQESDVTDVYQSATATDSRKESAPAEEEQAPQARVIDLSHQGLAKVPMHLFENVSTEQLDLSHNALMGALPAEIRHLQNLKILDMSNNRFTGVPAEVGQLRNLETLNLSNNQITGLPYELGNLKHLRVLDISGNQYSAQDLEVIRAQLPPTVQIKTR